jgi:CBS domain-containing protein
MAQMPDTKTAENNLQPERKAQAAANQVVAAENAAVTGIESAAHHGSAAANRAGAEAGESMRRSAAAGADATRYTAQLGAETVQQGADRLADGQRTVIEEMAKHLETLSQQMAQSVQEGASDLRSFIVPPQDANETLRDLQQGVSKLVSGVVQSNVRMTRELLSIANPSVMFDMQRRFMREYMDSLLQGSSAIIRATRHVAEQTLQPIEQRIVERQHGQEGSSDQQAVVSDVMTSDVRLINPEETVQQATRVMRDEDTGVLPVGEGDRLLGVVTDRDVTLRVVAEGKDPQRTKVREVMSQEPKYVYEDEALAHVADNMAQQQVRRLPVVSRDKRLVGIVSIGDLARGDRAGRFAGRAMRGVIRAGGAQDARSAAE